MFPPRCLGCGSRGGAVCFTCAQELVPATTRRSGLLVHTAGAYRGTLRRALLRLKENNDRRLLGWLAERAVTYLRTGGIAADAVSWIPTSLRRRRWRGYCAPERLARQVASRLGLPARAVLVCPGDPAPRKELRGFQARRSLAAEFQVFGPCAGRWILLDDVVTSGQTLKAGCSALRAAGAADVIPVALARSEAEPTGPETVGTFRRE